LAWSWKARRCSSICSSMSARPALVGRPLRRRPFVRCGAAPNPSPASSSNARTGITWKRRADDIASSILAQIGSQPLRAAANKVAQLGSKRPNCLASWAPITAKRPPVRASITATSNSPATCAKTAASARSSHSQKTGRHDEHPIDHNISLAGTVHVDVLNKSRPEYKKRRFASEH
jgi:hypothetical protein